jgi:hypothetical protein
MNVELNNKIWVSEVNEKTVLKVLVTDRSLNFLRGPSIWKTSCEIVLHSFHFTFLYIINVVLSAFSKMLCTLIYHMVPEHTEYCIFVLYCIVPE